jgi:UDP-glucose 4-epimerase
VIILARDDSDLAVRVIAVFGVGLIGSALVDALTSSPAFARREIPVKWTDPLLRGRQLATVEADLCTVLRSRRDASLRLVWAAGRAGFASTDPETRPELEAFRAVLDLARSVARKFPAARVSFVLISSAGGVFEGQRSVGARSVPSPTRPYGRLKRSQEELLEGDDGSLVAKIYRLTSVYGYVRPRQRLGVIPTLIRNGIRHQKTHIVGRMDTLRDFAWIEDISTFLARALVDDVEAATPSTFVLGSSKPSSLSEIQHIVEATLGRRIYVSYSLAPTNEVDITFAPSALPPGWHSSDLRSNVARVYKDALSSGTVFARDHWGGSAQRSAGSDDVAPLLDPRKV